MKKRISLLLALAVIISALSGCGSDTEFTTTSETTETASQTTSDTSDSVGSETSTTVLVNGNSLSTWKDIDRNKVIAYVEGGDSEKFDVTFGEFYSEYLYYLITYQINDDMSEEYKETCEQFRDDIITYITFERMFFEIAEEVGCGESTLTEEELQTISDNAEETRSTFAANYRTAAATELGETATDAEILEKANEMLEADLKRAETDSSIFLKWETSSYIQEKLGNYIIKDANATEEDVDAMFAEYVDMAKAAYEEDKVSYESDDTFTLLYVPEGTRIVDQIVISFDSETLSAISTARRNGDDEEADRLRNEAYNDEMKEKVENILSLIKSGEDFDTLQATYNDDVKDDTYSVIVDSELYVPEFTEAVFSITEIGGISEPVLSDYGVHVIKYIGDDYVTDEEIVDIKASMKEYLIYQESVRLQQEAYGEWLERFPYTIDYELLKITADEENVE